MLKSILATSTASVLALSACAVSPADTSTANAPPAPVMNNEQTIGQPADTLMSDNTGGLHGTDDMYVLPGDKVQVDYKEKLADAREEEVEMLNDVTSIFIDAEALYGDASKLPDNDDQVRMIITEIAQERAAQRADLQAYVNELGGEPDSMGEALGAGHRAFTQMRTAFSNDSAVALEEVLRGERYIVDEIGKVLQKGDNLSGVSIEKLNMIRANVMEDIREIETYMS
ncbi:PA2169 family four-helix-bundle protein [Hirschia litorea]|uniref:PA2169 family four-helix-bundle protein n=1 Tax=Hirschia litorea TaxID=1199156 RepID=A0ABW2ILL0_9PROT